MSKLVVSGYYGFGNAGDEAMLLAMVDALKNLDPQIEITVFSGNPADTRARFGIKAVHRLNLWEILRALHQADLLISGGGSLLQDVTSGRSIFYYLGVMQLAVWLGCPIMLYAQGIGPIRSGIARNFMKRIGKRIAAGTVRDEGSLAELAGLGVAGPAVKVTADPVLALQPVSPQAGRRMLAQMDCCGEGPLIGFSLREWKSRDHYKEVIATVADRLVDEMDARILFIPMQWPDDVQAARTVSVRMKNQGWIIDKKCSTAELLSLVSNLDLLVGVRLHALIFAAVMEKPFVGVSYDPKIDRFLATIGESQAGTLDNLSVEGLWGRIRQALSGELPSDYRQQRMVELREKALENAKCALGLLTKKRGKQLPVES